MAEPVLKKGSNEPAVRDLQEAMKTLGHDPGPIDGVFGEATEAAVKAFRQEKGITVDGIVGEVTWINIDEADQSEPILRIGSYWASGSSCAVLTDATALRPRRRSRNCSSNP